jgi:hypothetical protein
MIYRKTLPYLTVFLLCLLTSIACGQDWLGGGYVGPYVGINPDEGLAGMLQWLNTPFTNYPWYHTGGAFYPGPYGVFPYNPEPYYSDFRLNSLAGMNWEPFQPNWSATTDYAQTKSSFRVYPRPTITNPAIQFPAPTYATTQSPIATTGDSTATIVSQGMRGYQVFLDGNYVGTEGTGGDPLDGRFSFKVVGNQNHEVRVTDGQFNYPKTIFFDRGGTKIINVEPGTAVYV